MNRQRSWFRQSAAPAGRLLAIYLAVVLAWFFLTLRSPSPLIPDSVLVRVLPDAVLTRALGTAAAKYQRVPMPGSAEVHLDSDGFHTAFIEIDSDVREPEWISAEPPSTSYTIDMSDGPPGTRSFFTPGVAARYELPGRTGIPYRDLRVPQGTYRVATRIEGTPDPRANPELVIGPKLTHVLGGYLSRVAAALALVVGLVAIVSRGWRWLTASDERREKAIRQQNRRQTWRELLRERNDATTSDRRLGTALRPARCPTCGGHDVSCKLHRRDTDALKQYVRRRAAAAAVVFVLGSPGVIVLVWMFAPDSVVLMWSGVVAYFALVCLWVRLSRRTRISEHPEDVVFHYSHVCPGCGHTWITEV